jgi:hypothetical protein
MNLIAELWFAIEHVDSLQQCIQIHEALIHNQPFTDLLILIVSEINKYIDLLYSNTFPNKVAFYETIIASEVQ